MIQGLFETHLDVSDVERSVVFYRDVLGLELAHRIEARKVAFFWIRAHEDSGEGRAMLGLWQKPAEDIRRMHFAFRAKLEDVLQAKTWLQARGLEPRNFLNESSQEPMVFAWMPALAIYFSDPDGHSLEFISMLEGQARPDLGVLSWQNWQNWQEIDEPLATISCE